MKDCVVKEKSGMIAKILENIPRWDEDAVPLWTLCPSERSDERYFVGCVSGILSLLRVFDVISVTTAQTENKIRVKARSETAFYFLRSLSQFIRNGMVLTSNWERRGVRDNLSPPEVIGSGTQLVHAMEKIRTEENGDITTIRKVFVSQAIIKAKIKGKREPMYLVQYDAPAGQFQLVGGRRRKSETEPLTVMKREMAEELSANNLRYPKDYQLLELVSNLEHVSLSPTYGAFSSYSFTIYHATFKCRRLVLGHDDRWVSYSELISGEAKDRRRIESEIVRKVDTLLPGGLKKLKLSLDVIQP